MKISRIQSLIQSTENSNNSVAFEEVGVISEKRQRPLALEVGRLDSISAPPHSSSLTMAVSLSIPGRPFPHLCNAKWNLICHPSASIQ